MCKKVLTALFTSTIIYTTISRIGTWVEKIEYLRNFVSAGEQEQLTERFVA